MEVVEVVDVVLVVVVVVVVVVVGSSMFTGLCSSLSA